MTSQEHAVEAAQRILSLQLPQETSAKFAERLGLTPQALSYYKKRKGASLEAAVKVCDATGVSPRWLLTGKGPMQEEDPKESQLRLRAVREILGREISAVAGVLSLLEELSPAGEDATVALRVAEKAEEYGDGTETLRTREP